MQDQFKQASVLLSKGQAPKAEKLLRQLLEKAPNNENVMSLLGHSLLMQNKLPAAIEQFVQLTHLHPKSANAQIELANVYLRNKQFLEAEQAFTMSVKLNPNYSEAWHFLGNLRMQRGARSQAKECFIKAERSDPFRQQFAKVKQLMEKRAFHQAEKICRQVLEKHPNHPQALFVLAKFAEQVEAYEQAVSILNRGLKYAPYHISLWRQLVKSYSHMGMLKESIEAAKKLVAIDPSITDHFMTLAVEQANAGFFEQALDNYDQALKLSPKVANIHIQRGHVLKTLGRREECEQAYLQSLALEKVNGTAYWALADLKSHRFDEQQINAMAKLLADESINPAQRSQAAFALAKAFEDSFDYRHAFEYYKLANHLRPEVQYDPDDYGQMCQQIIKTYSPKTLECQAHFEGQPATPIFIVGLTRSGSTLIEQMLASHSLIEGTMELYSLPRTVRRAGLINKIKELSYPEFMSQFSVKELTDLGQSYLDETAIYRHGKPYFIDKMPPNFHNVGLIQMILPHAIIIDARRHPLSTGLSNFKQHFARGYDFSYQLAHIGHYYNCYLNLMDHWDKAMPKKVLCVQYENMVQDTENQLRKVLRHVGVEFEPQCLDFHKNKRAVRTASSEQVRQPINTKGMEQWRHFEPYLQDLKNALGEKTLARFAKWE